jgi:hypothetical protein
MLLNVETNLKEAQQALDKLVAEQIPFATAYALTQTAKAAQREVEKEIARVFDRPTPFTLQAVRTKPATKTRQSAEVLLKDFAAKGNPAVRWLRAEVYGGARKQKAFERLLSWSGAMPAGWYAVPTKYAPIDAYGNVSGAQINRILSQLQSRRDLSQNESAAQKTKRNSMGNRSKQRLARYFAVLPGRTRTGHLTPGIYERIGFGFGSAVRPIFIYTQKAPRYSPRLRFDRIVSATVDAQLAFQFKRGVQIAQATAK